MTTAKPRTRRHKQLAPTADVLEAVYESLDTAHQRVFNADLQNDDVMALAQSIRHIAVAVDLLADIVDRHITAPDVETRCDA